LREARDLGAHRRRIVAVVEGRAIVEADAVERTHRAKLDIVGQVASAEAPEFLEEEGRRDDRRSRVEGESVLAVHIGAAARSIELFKDSDVVAARSEPHRGGESAEAAANDDRPRPRLGGVQFPTARRECQHGITLPV
jgi:hypothetical protein